jgi:hypothetical protein
MQPKQAIFCQSRPPTCPIPFDESRSAESFVFVISFLDFCGATHIQDVQERQKRDTLVAIFILHKEITLAHGIPRYNDVI